MNATAAAIRVSAFRWVPPFAQGLVRDLRVRWALEEAGRPYEERLIGREEQGSAQYRALQPFGQVPAYEEDGLALFESGAIVMHIAESAPELLPQDEVARAHTRCWMLAALNTVEPPIVMLNILDRQPGATAEAGQGLRQTLLDRMNQRLDGLAAALGTGDYLVQGRFTAADLLMSAVLRVLHTTDVLDARPALAAYRQRCEGRPAFQRALAAQMAVFKRHAPPAPEAR